jgi:aminoglycoside phosphotransferase (APT) family kinase protein
MPEWDPEIAVDAALARRLIGEQFPELRAATVQLLAAGWDNTVFVVGDRWAFRFPRRAVAIPGVEREMRHLPVLAPRLPVPIPLPLLLGVPSSAFAWPFFGARLLPGAEPTTAFDDVARQRLAAPLAQFLRALHGTELAGDLPHDPMGRVDMTRRVPFARERVAELAARGLADHRAAAETLLREATDLPPSPRRATVHGDLHFRHVLVDAGRANPLAGIIDWGDLCRGDPAMDLHLAWSLLPRAARPAFWTAYGPIEPDQALRARVVGLFLGAVLALYGERERMPALRDEALASLARVLVA